LCLEKTGEQVHVNIPHRQKNAHALPGFLIPSSVTTTTRPSPGDTNAPGSEGINALWIAKEGENKQREQQPGQPRPQSNSAGS